MTIALEAAVTGLLQAVRPYFPLADFPIPYIILMMVVAYLFGTGPTVLASVMGLIAHSYFFVPPVHIFWPPANTARGWAGLTGFFIGALIVGFGTVLMQRSRHSVQRLADELRKSNQRCTSILESIADAFFALDHEWRFTYLNAEAERLLRRRREELIGKNVWHEFPEAVGSTFHRQYQRAVSEQVVVEFEEFYASANRWVGVRAYPSRDGLSVYIRDVTERVKLQRALEETLDKERNFSHVLQQALLPGKPSIGAGYAVAAGYAPAFAGQEVGGDFYDAFRTVDGKAGILIGDVSGKGIEAAALAAAARSTIRAFAYETSSASEALTRANPVLQMQQPESGSFVTVLLAILDLPSGILHYSSAGHPPAAIHRADGSVTLLCFGDPPVGLVEKQEFGRWDEILQPGDNMVLYTDGVAEARRDGEMFATEGVVRVLARHRRDGPETLVAEMLSAANDWANGRFRDDAAVVVVERRADRQAGAASSST